LSLAALLAMLTMAAQAIVVTDERAWAWIFQKSPGAS